MLAIVLTTCLIGQSVSDDLLLAPPPPTLDKSGPQAVQKDGEGTWFPHPTDTHFFDYVAAWQEYPSQAQARILRLNSVWAADFERQKRLLTKDCEVKEVEHIVETSSNWSPLEVTLGIGAAVVVTAAVAGTAGYFVGKAKGGH